eukprot:8526257-Alexandrium_andersonii.AAC.1
MKKVFGDMTRGKDHVRVQKKLDKEYGVFEPFAVIVEKMGYMFDLKGAVRRAQAYCDKCLLMGDRGFEVSCMTNEV